MDCGKRTAGGKHCSPRSARSAWINPASQFPWFAGHIPSAYDFFAHFHEEHQPDMRAWLRRAEDEGI